MYISFPKGIRRVDREVVMTIVVIWLEQNDELRHLRVALHRTISAAGLEEDF
jgi:hypothetical protein